ncbi:MAG: hypothetical protein Ct9H300mP19_04820 [Dehalococcoidia bacterium]|nr:MAG: hypothetical protein Ct9H300mP19_04820 [Dehalococcoidia bacterium]
MSVLIGLKSLWHQGYGSSSVMAMLEHIFEHLRGTPRLG